MLFFFFFALQNVYLNIFSTHSSYDLTFTIQEKIFRLAYCNTCRYKVDLLKNIFEWCLRYKILQLSCQKIVSMDVKNPNWIYFNHFFLKLRSSYEDFNSIGLGMINFDISCRRVNFHDIFHVEQFYKHLVNEEFECNLIHEYHENGGWSTQ